MPSLLDNYPPPPEGRMTFAEPDETLSFSERLKKAADVAKTASMFTPGGLIAAGARGVGAELIDHPADFPAMFHAADRQNVMVDQRFSDDHAREEAYDRRIKAVKTATGIELPNPERGGYALNERELRALSADGPIDPTAYRRQRFEQELSATIADNPGKAGDLQFGDINAEAKAIAAGAEHDYEAARRDTKLSTGSSLAMQFAGAMWGQRRDPMTIPLLLAGPTSAVGRTVAARIATSGLFQGLYNAGVAALDQPAVQAWRQEIGVRSGVQPAAENVGFAFLAGLIPGAVLRGVHEGLTAGGRAAVQRVMNGVPEAGDIEKAMQAARSALGEIDAEMSPTARAAIKLGDDIDEAGRATAPARAKDVPPELHDDMTVAAQRYGEDPVNQPSPAAVAAVDAMNPPSPRVFAGDNVVALGRVSDTGPERLIRAAVKVDGDIFTGNVHIDGVELAARKLGKTIEEVSDLVEAQADGAGFLTSKGRYVDRTEASHIAEARGQAKDIPADRSDFVAENIKGDTERPQDALGTRTFLDDIKDAFAATPPRTEREAQMAADEVFDDIGRRKGMEVRQADIAEQAEVRQQLREANLPAEKLPKNDPFGMVPMLDNKGRPDLVSDRAAARAGERELKFADIIRECE